MKRGCGPETPAPRQIYLPSTLVIMQSSTLAYTSLTPRMKFGAYLADNMVTEWSPFYFNYKKSKKLIKKLKARKEEAVESNQDPDSRGADREFEEFLLEERRRIQEFYAEQVEKLGQNLQNLEDLCMVQLKSRVTKRQRKNSETLRRRKGSAITDDEMTSNQKPTIVQMQRDRSFSNAEKGTEEVVVQAKTALTRAKATKIKKNARELYKAMYHVKNYGILNNQAFHKSCKKYDKNLVATFKTTWIPAVISEDSFYLHTDIEKMIHDLESLIADHFYKGKKRIAQTKLRSMQERYNVFPYVSAGFLAGMVVPLLLYIFKLLLQNKDSIISGLYLPLYRVLFMPIFFVWAAAFDMYVWSENKVNFKFIMELDARQSYTWSEVANVAGILSVIVLSAMALTLANESGDINFKAIGIPSYAFTIIAGFMTIAIIINPRKLHMRYGRWVLAKTIYRVVTAPFHTVVFLDFFLADQMTSVVKGFSGLSLVGCAILSSPEKSWDNVYTNCETTNFVIGPMIALAPLWFRFAQCMRRYVQSGFKLKTQLVNSGKYATSILAGLIGALSKSCVGHDECVWSFFALQVIANSAATCYSFAWDIKMDWGLLQKGKGWPLRSTTVYPRWWYYVAGVINLALRLTWVLTLSVGHSPASWPNSEVAVFVFALLEIYRRAQWNLFRVENEQVNNLENYRVFKDIVVPTTKDDSDDDDAEVTGSDTDEK